MYSKHKDADPKDTVQRIKEILGQMGIEPSVKLLKNTNGIYSAFLADRKHGWHVNGKGTSEEYCMASAYGEAMERLQAYFMYDCLDESESEPENAFRIYPDEKIYKTIQCKNDYPVIYENLRSVYALEQKKESGEIQDDELDKFLCSYFMQKTVLTPYYSLLEDKVTYLPEQMISALCGSNGLSAGNTPCEALNQGISELLERHVKEQIFKNGITPPEIPRSFLKEKMPDLYETIIQIESMGPFKIILKDASLGIGMPVVGALFVDRSNQRYHVKFGASFSIFIAVERCLTELFQGFDIKDHVSHEHLMTGWDVKKSAEWNSPANRQLQLKSDTGSIPISFIAGKEAWGFRDWDETSGYGKSSFGNEEALRFMLEKLAYFEPDIYIRDYSFLGFPTYRIFVPGVSDTHLPLGPKRMRYRMEKTSVDLLKRFPAVRLNQQAIEECFHFITGEDNLVREPFDDVPTAAVQAVFYYLYDDIENAIQSLRSLPEKQFVKKYQCAAMELELQLLGMEMEERDQILHLFYEEKYVRYATRAFRKMSDRTDHSYLIDRVMDPQSKKVFQAGAAPVFTDRARMHQVMREQMIKNMPTQKKLKQVIDNCNRI